MVWPTYADVPTLLECSVRVITPTGGGSGSIFINDEVAFVWTCEHVVRDLKTVQISNNLIEYYEADVICKSWQQDICLLRIRGPSPYVKSIRFDLNKPVVADKIIHIGSPCGDIGINSYFEGHISSIERWKEGTLYDQINCNAFFGCSGGGVFNSRGHYIGLLSSFVYNNTYGMFLIIPSREIHNFAIQNDVMYAISINYKVPRT